MKRWLALIALAVAPLVNADIREQTVNYRAGDTELVGFLAWDDAIAGRRPGVLVVHEWWGLNDYARKRARMLAAEGYTALAVDMYGGGRSTEHPKEATGFMNSVISDQGAAKQRLQAAQALLQKQQTTDPQHIAAIGYCFGGGVVLEAARNGANLDLVASFHGMLGTQKPAESGAVKARVLVFNGADDPMVKPEQVTGFEQEMKSAGASYRLENYPGVTHGFTNPDADRLATATGLPIAYDAKADADSWQKLLTELKTAFAAKP